MTTTASNVFQLTVLPAATGPTALASQIALLAAQGSPGWLQAAGAVKDISSLLNASASMGDGYSVLQVGGGDYSPNNTWCNHLNYDPTAKQILGYCGAVSSGIVASLGFRIRYDEQANIWTRLVDPFAGTPTGHGLYGNAIDVAGRRAWRMNNATDNAYTATGTKQINLDTLTVTGSIPRLGSSAGPGVAYLPAKNWLISCENQTIKRWDLAAGGPWTAIGGVRSDMQDNACVALQHPVTGRVLVGGGVNSGGTTYGTAVYEIDTDGTTVRRTALPTGVLLSEGGSFQSLACADPGSTNWVIFNYDYAIWELSSGGTPAFRNTGVSVPTAGTFAAPNDPSAMNNRSVVSITGTGAILLLVNRYFNAAVAAGLYRHT